MWRGPALAGLPGPQARIQRERLAELRLSVLMERVELDLRLGGHGGLVAELTGLCLEHPLNDRLRTLRDAALERGGREREARTTPPGAEAPPPPPTPTAPPHLPVPAQLPYVPGDFTGRAEAVRDLLDALAPTAPETVVVCAVGGIGGIGKTTLAVHAAGRLRKHFPDGQLYANLGGVREDPADPAAVLAGFLRALGVTDPALPEEPRGTRRALPDPPRGQADPARPRRRPGRRPDRAAPARIAHLRRARHQPQHPVRTPGRPAPAPRRLARRRGAGPARPDRGGGAHRRRARRGRGPRRALRRSAPRRCASRDPGSGRGRPGSSRTSSASSTAAAPRSAPGSAPPSPAGTGPEGSVEACFRLSYDLLDAGQARLFRLMAVPRTPTLDLASAAALAGLDPAEAERHLERLTALGLLESPAPLTYRFHDLLGEFAAARSEERDSPGDRTAALLRLADHMLACAREAYAAERPGHPLVGLLTPTTARGAPFEAGPRTSRPCWPWPCRPWRRGRRPSG
ncbi:hypothetical protein GCM10020254_11150 [Streptomyces goshikiensis]